MNPTAASMCGCGNPAPLVSAIHYLGSQPRSPCPWPIPMTLSLRVSMIFCMPSPIHPPTRPLHHSQTVTLKPSAPSPPYSLDSPHLQLLHRQQLHQARPYQPLLRRHHCHLLHHRQHQFQPLSQLKGCLHRQPSRVHRRKGWNHQHRSRVHQLKGWNHLHPSRVHQLKGWRHPQKQPSSLKPSRMTLRSPKPPLPTAPATLENVAAAVPPARKKVSPKPPLFHRILTPKPKANRRRHPNPNPIHENQNLRPHPNKFIPTVLVQTDVAKWRRQRRHRPRLLHEPHASLRSPRQRLQP